MENQELTIANNVFPESPQQVLDKAQEIVSLVAKKCTGTKFISIIQGNKYPKVEWWTTVGASLGLFPYVIGVDPIRDGDKILGYHARVEVRNTRTNPPTPITSAEASCMYAEKNWKTRDEHALKSMAQTRATSKAYRLGLSFIAVLAGLEPTPAEEMPIEEKNGDYADRVKRIESWLLAECNGDKTKISEFLKSITKNRFSFIDEMTNAQFEKFFHDNENNIKKFEGELK